MTMFMDESDNEQEEVEKESSPPEIQSTKDILDTPIHYFVHIDYSVAGITISQQSSLCLMHWPHQVRWLPL